MKKQKKIPQDQMEIHNSKFIIHNSGASTGSITRISPTGEIRTEPDTLAVESPLQILINEQPYVVLMRTPGHDRELGTGFLLTEGIIESTADLYDVTRCTQLTDGQPDPNQLNLIVNEASLKRLETKKRNALSTASCGICGTERIEQLFTNLTPLTPSEQKDYPAPAILAALPETARKNQPLFQSTGGTHATTLFDFSGNILSTHEDIGRHNALDKAIGNAHQTDTINLNNTIALLSGRASHEMLAKSIIARIPIVLTIGSSSTLAQKATEYGIKLAKYDSI